MVHLKQRTAGFMRDIRSLDGDKYVEKYFLFSAAPVLAGVKPSALISFSARYRAAWEANRERICAIAALEAVVISERRDAFQLFIYNRRHLECSLKNPTAAGLLREYGYPERAELEKLLTILSARFEKCKFPHEIGVFLGYPPEDVVAFIENCGRNCICCRYWKVYHNEQRARETFRLIDEAKSSAIELLSQSVPIHRAARTLAELKIA